MPIILRLLSDYNAFRSRKKNSQKRTVEKLPNRLARVIERFQSHVKKLGVTCISDVRPRAKNYHEILIAMAEAVEDLDKLKTKTPIVPMLGSKALHFTMPEFFPVWDTERIKKQCLAHENMTDLKEEIAEVIDALETKAAKEYAVYVHLLVTERAKISRSKYQQVENACIAKALGPRDARRANWAKQVLDWDYDDMSTVVFEICLLGKHRRHIKPRK